MSGCQHTDRELYLVPKKGRPVTQCQHCRQERKKRSAHVSCDCGQTEKQHHSKEKCIHLREAEDRAKLGIIEDLHLEKDAAHLAAVAEEQGCCCHHGGKCTCAILKKETEEDADDLHGPAVKPRLEKTSSDTAITVFTNGHHKPVHRKNHAAHECGMPYKMPMARSHTEQGSSSVARRSVDSLALDIHIPYQTSSFVPQTSAHFNTERRKSKSEQPSPKLNPVNPGCHGLADNRFTSIDFASLSQTQTNQSIQSTVSDSFGFPSYDTASGLSENNFAWSSVPSANNAGVPFNNYFDVWPTTTENGTFGQPALTAASSGTTSEIDEMPQMEEDYRGIMPSIQEDGDFDLIKIPSGGSPQLNRRSLPPSFFGNVDFESGMYPEAQLPGDNFPAGLESKNRLLQGGFSSTCNDPWQMPDPRSVPNVAQRALGGLPYTPRPQSRSLGPANAPGDDIIKQLFPELDVNGGSFGPTSSPQMNFTIDRNISVPQSSGPTYSENFSPMDAEMNFSSQAFSDGSLSIPNDTFTSSYDMDQIYSSQEFSNNWSR